MVNIYTHQPLYRMNQNVYPTKTPTENSSSFWGLERLLGMAIGYCGGFAVSGWTRTFNHTVDSQGMHLYNFYPQIIPNIQPLCSYLYLPVYSTTSGTRYYFYLSGDSNSSTYSNGNTTTYYINHTVKINDYISAPHGCFCIFRTQYFPANATLTQRPRSFNVTVRPMNSSNLSYASALNMSGVATTASNYPSASTALYPPVGNSGPLSAGLINGLNKECERLLKQPLVILNITAPVCSGSEIPQTMGTSLAPPHYGLIFYGYDCPSSFSDPKPDDSRLLKKIPTYVPPITYSITRWIPYRLGAPDECNLIHVVFLMDVKLLELNKGALDWDESPEVTVDISGMEMTTTASFLWSYTPPNSSANLWIFHAAFKPIMRDDLKMTVGNRDFWPFKVKKISCTYIDANEDAQEYLELVQSICVWIGGEVVQ